MNTIGKFGRCEYIQQTSNNIYRFNELLYKKGFLAFDSNNAPCDGFCWVYSVYDTLCSTVQYLYCVNFCTLCRVIIVIITQPPPFVFVCIKQSSVS